MMTKEQTEQGILCKGICSDCKDRFGCYQSNIEPTKEEKFAFDMFKDYPKEIVILAMGNYQQMHVEESNRAYRAEKVIKELVKWIDGEIEAIVTTLKRNEGDERYSEILRSYKHSFDRTKTKIEKLSHTEESKGE